VISVGGDSCARRSTHSARGSASIGGGSGAGQRTRSARGSSHGPGLNTMPGLDIGAEECSCHRAGLALRIWPPVRLPSPVRPVSPPCTLPEVRVPSPVCPVPASCTCPERPEMVREALGKLGKSEMREMLCKCVLLNIRPGDPVSSLVQLGLAPPFWSPVRLVRPVPAPHTLPEVRVPSLVPTMPAPRIRPPVRLPSPVCPVPAPRTGPPVHVHSPGTSCDGPQSGTSCDGPQTGCL
jgi:hypothetical protein